MIFDLYVGDGLDKFFFWFGCVVDFGNWILIGFVFLKNFFDLIFWMLFELNVGDGLGNLCGLIL